MVEYALLTGGIALQTLYSHVTSFAGSINWVMVGAVVLVVVTFRLLSGLRL